MNDFAEAVNRGDAKAISALFTEDAVSVGPGDTKEQVTAVVGPQRIGESLASLTEGLGLRLTNPGTVIQHGNWVSQPVDIFERSGFNIVQLVDGKISYQVLLFYDAW